jgi:hypothetical protein
MVSKDQSIIMQVCAKIASELTPKGDDVNTNIVMFADAYEAVCEIILTSQGLGNTIGVDSSSATTTTVAQTFPSEEQMVQQAFPTAQPAQTTNTTATGFSVRIKGQQHGPIPAWLNDACALKGVKEVWDNRDGLQANPKRPWFKSTSSNDAFWAPK